MEIESLTKGEREALGVKPEKGKIKIEKLLEFI